MFTKRDLEGEAKGQWYLRQMLGSSNIDAGPVMAFMTGNLSYQIEHQLYRICEQPAGRDLGAGAPGVRQIRPALHHGFAAGAVRQGVATIAKLSLPNMYLSESADDAPETRIEKMFAELEPAFVGTDPATGRRRGLKTMATVRQWRRRYGLRR